MSIDRLCFLFHSGLNEFFGLQRFLVYLLKRGDTVVPLQQGSGWAGAFYGARVKLPDRVKHRVIMRIEDVFFELGMAGDMNLGHALRIDAVEVIKRIEA